MEIPINRLKKEKEAYFKKHRVNNRSEKTINNYNLAIDKFINYLAANNIIILKEANLNKILEDYKIDLKINNSYKDSTINQYILNINIYLKYLGFSPKVERIKEEAITQIKYLTPEEINEVIKTIPIIKKDPETIKQYTAIICLMFYSGARVGEIEKANINDVKTDNKGAFIILHGKGNKTIKQPITNKVYNMLKELKRDDKEPALFINQYGRRLKVRDIQRNIKKLAIATDKRLNENGQPADPPIVERLTPHALRHSYAIYLLMDKQRPINEVKGLLRHNNILTTEKYLKLNNDVLRKKYNETFKNE